MICLLLPQVIIADIVDYRRVNIGIRLFRTLLAADYEISNKTNVNGDLDLVIIAHGNLEKTELVADELRKSGRGESRGTIRNIRINVEIMSSDVLLEEEKEIPAGIFIYEDLSDEKLSDLVEYGINHKVIVYSPLEGDVEKGVLGGIYIGARVQPQINTQTLKQSKIKIKELFLKVAKLYE